MADYEGAVHMVADALMKASGLTGDVSIRASYEPSADGGRTANVAIYRDGEQVYDYTWTDETSD